MNSILFAANADLAAPLIHDDEIKPRLLHLPLEEYSYFMPDEENKALNETIDKFTFVIHGNLRNARFFVKWMEQSGVKDTVLNRIHLAVDRPAAEYLEQHGIPAVLPKADGKPIDVMEFILRISRDGHTLYPTAEGKTEEMPGLLQELDLPVSECTVCREITIEDAVLERYRQRISEKTPEAILFHNRSSYVRIKTAFPELNPANHTLIAGSRGMAEHLESEGFYVETHAHGTWPSIRETVREFISGE